MTDAAVIADSPSVPEVEGGAAINENAAAPNSPLGSQIPPDAQAKEPKAPPSLDDSIDRAMAKSAEKQAAPKDAKPDVKAEPVAKEPVKAEQPRENGKFASKDAFKETVKSEGMVEVGRAEAKPEGVKPSHTAEDAPARFTETAKAKWASADPELRGEVRRMEKELTEGYQKHREKAEKWDSIGEFDEMATKSGTTVKEALSRYVNLENKIRGDLLGGLDEVISNATQGKASLRDVAAHIMGQTPDQQASQADATIRELKQHNASLEERLSRIEGGFKQQQEHSTLTEINRFASEHPRFDELSADIAFFMSETPIFDAQRNIIGMNPPRAKDLPEAYQLAERLNPAPAKAAEEPLAASSAAAIDPPVHPDKGQKSINGAPSAGLTSPRGKRASQSIDEALNRAFSSVG